MNKIKKLWNDHKIWFIIGVLILLSLISTFCYFYSDIALNFKKDNPNGEFFKVILSILGGIGLFYGLWINSQRIKAQNKQNKLVEDRNQDQKSYDADKRFGEAIGYLGSDKTSIILGGIYALYQLAKEDKRYKPIIAGLFTSYLQDKSEQLYELSDKESAEQTEPRKLNKVPIIVRTIVDLLFNTENVFNAVKLNLSSVLFKHIIFNNDVRNCNFDFSEFQNCNFNSNIINCSFEITEISSCRFGNKESKILQCEFWGSNIKDITFSGDRMNSVNFDLVSFNKSSFKISHLIKCNFQAATFINKAELSDVDSFAGTKFNKESKDILNFKNCKNRDEIEYT